MSKEKQCECCHEWWYGSDVKEDLCPNCYYYFKQLKQQLAEKDKEIAHLKEKDNYHLRYELAGADETITNLKQQLEEKDKEIEDMDKDLVFNANEIKRLIQEKKRLKQNQKQLAITELEKVHAMLVSKAREVVGTGVVAVRLYTINEVIDQQIKELKGENK